MLLEILLGNSINSTTEKEAQTLVIDIIAQFCSITTNLPHTFEDLIIYFLKSVPKGYQHIDIVADRYRDYNIKSAEREKQGSSIRIRISSVKSRIPRDALKFFSNGENKTQLFALTFSYLKNNHIKCLAMLNCDVVIISRDSQCIKVTSECFSQYNQLKRDQEEADTKVVLHALHALSTSQNNVCICSPSGDTNI